MPFTDPPSSKRILDHLINNILDKASNNVSSTLIAFKGSGHTSELLYLCRNIESISTYNPKTLIALFDLSLFNEQENEAIKDTLNMLLTYFQKHLSKQAENIVTQSLSKGPLTITDFVSVLSKLTFEEHYNVSLIIDNFSLVFDTTSGGKRLCETIKTLKKLNPMQISFIFLVDKDFTKSDLLKIEDLSNVFIQNIVYGKDMLFDLESTEQMAKNQETWHGYAFSKEFISKVGSISFGDPSVCKIIITKALQNKDFETKIITEESIENIYKIIGEEELDFRFNKIINSLSKTSQNCLYSTAANDTEFLDKTGLVRFNSSSEKETLNPLFDVYLNKTREAFDKGFVGTQNTKSIYTYLQGKEISVMELFEKNAGRVVSRDDVAKVLWGDNYEKAFSEESIDNIVSRIRAKLKEHNYGKTLKTFRGRGVSLM